MIRRSRVGVAAAVVAVALLGAPLAASGPVSPVAAQAPPAEASPPSVAWVGDSVAFQALFKISDLLRRDRTVRFSRSGLGLNIRDVLPAVRRGVTGRVPPDILIVVLGTAQSNEDRPQRWREELTRLLSLASPRVDCIRVFDVDDTKTGLYRRHDRYARAYNAITRQVVNGYPNAEWYHYEAWAELAGRDLELVDILHHRPAGKAAIARQVRDAARSCDPAFTSGPFWDVRDTSQGAGAIAWLHEQGLFRGYGNGTYRATIDRFTIPATREATLAMAWRLAGRPGGYGPHPWTDVRAGLEAAARWAHGERLVRGFGSRFLPGRSMARADAVALLWRLAGAERGLPPTPWPDADGPAARWAAVTGVLPGFSDGTFRPRAPLTRARLAQLLYRFAHLPPAPPPPGTGSAPPTTAPPAPPPTTAPVAPPTVPPAPPSTAPPTTVAPPTTAPTTTDP